MNQILFNKKINKRIRVLFKVQLLISILVLLILGFYFNFNRKDLAKKEKISYNINKNIKLSLIYNSYKTNYSNIYLGKIYINKINLEYVIFNYLNEEALKIAPCKYYGNEIGKKGNLCIVGHNYNDNRFFGNLNKLEVGDDIILERIQGEKFKYIIFDIFETDENDFSILNQSKDYELTLITCNNSNNKRIIVKANK